MAKKKTSFQIDFPENLKKDATLSSTPKLAFDDLGDFLEERNRIKRLLETANEAVLKVDYSDFANHVFFDSAVSKYKIAQDRILLKYPYNGNSEEKDAFFLTSSDYENYVYEQWPRHVGYLQFSGSSTYFSASDYDKKLVFGTSSLMLSVDVRVDPGTVGEVCNIIAIQSGTSALNTDASFRMYFSGGGASGGPISLVSEISSGAFLADKVNSYDTYAYSGSWHNIAIAYYRDQSLFKIYVDGNEIDSTTVAYGPIEQNTVYVFGGGGSGYDVLSGAIDNVRLYLTASELLLQKHINKSIDSEDYLVLNYTFNEGAVGTSSVDLNVVDYSKSALHGFINNYSPSVRVSGTSRFNDFGDPILYSFHSGVITFSGTNALSASNYDRENNNQIFNLIPEYVLKADQEQEGLMMSFSLALARFFDELKLYIDQFDNLRITNYDDIDESPDIFLPFLTRYFGWKVTEHFGDANPLSFFFGEGVKSSGSLDVSLLEIRNQFWRRTLNNLPYLLQTKGKRYNLDAFFNVLGVNKENINLKEYGYLPGGSIADTRIHKEKVSSFLGIGTGSFSSSFVKVPSLITGSNNVYTVESFLQLPYQSSSYSASLSVLTGSVWQFVDPNQVTGSFALLWNVPSLGSSTGKFILTGSDGQKFSSSLVEVFDGDFTYLAAGLDSAQKPFIYIRTLDNDSLDFTGSFSGSVAFSGVFTGSNYHFIMGATSGTFFQKQTQGFFGEYRFWNRPLSASEIYDHALNFQSVGIRDPAESPHPLIGHWPLGENKLTDAAGNLNTVLDLSRNGRIATGTLFPASYNSYKKFLVEYNHLSPSIDLKWTENKIRIRNKTELRLSDIANDTNEVSLEFNLVDALNKDITKIFSTFDLFNSAIGNPVNKYRDEYAELESYRKVYFDRLGDSIHFNQFFGLFRWFDKKISDAIKQLLPTRVKFIGGEQVVESHFLERPKYQYKYPIFRTPVDLPNAELSGVVSTDGKMMDSFVNSVSARGTEPRTSYESSRYSRDTSVFLEVSPSLKTVSHYDQGDERPDRLTHREGFFRIKYSGDEKDTSNNPNASINSRNEFSKRSFVNSSFGRYNVFNNVDNYLGNAVNNVIGCYGDYGIPYKKHYPIYMKNLLTGSAASGIQVPNAFFSGNILFFSSSTAIVNFFNVSGALYIQDSKVNDESFYVNNISSSFIEPYTIKSRFVKSLSVEFSRSHVADSSGYLRASFRIVNGTYNNVNTGPQRFRAPESFFLTASGFAGDGSSTRYTDIENGWIKAEIALNGRITASFSLRPCGVGEFLGWQLEGDGMSNLFALRNFKVELYPEGTTPEGKKFFQNVDNQFVEKNTTFVNSNLLRHSFLNNVKYVEFPHSLGLFQMKNIVLGTITSGKVGKTDDSIVQIKHIGSVVNVMWPRQDSIEKPIKGFGDFSAGERSGKLTTAFQPGESFDVSKDSHDHMTLYCYLRKEISGTLDDVIISVERKPLKNLGFAQENSVDYNISGSKTEARLYDIEYKKQIDYGDLSIREVGFPIDVSLTNTKEVRISVRHRLGQAEENKNFICWGRFIKHSKDTNEV